MAHAAGGFAFVGDAQASEYVLRTTTTTTNYTELFLDGSSRRLIVPQNGYWGFQVVVIGKDKQWGEAAAFKFEGSILNDAGTMKLLGTPTKTSLGSNIYTVDTTIDIDAANHALVIKAKGFAISPNFYRWVAVVRTTEVIN